MIRKIALVMILSVVIALCFLQVYHFLKTKIVTTDFKALTEKRMGEFLHARVRVSSISIGFIRHISVRDLEIDRSKTDYPFLIGVKKIIFRYDFSDFFKRNFRFPQRVFLDSPRLTLQALESPGSLFDTRLLEGEHGIATRFDLEGGEIDLPTGLLASAVKLAHIQGHAVPVKGNSFRISLRGSLEGMLKGDLSVHGTADPVSKQTNLTLNFFGVGAADYESFPLSGLNGSMELVGSQLNIPSLQFKFRGIPCKLSGSIDRIFSDTPVLRLLFSVDEGALAFRSQVNADLGEELFSGTVQLFDEKQHFSGVVIKEEGGFRVPQVTFDNGYEGSGQFNLRTGTYRVKAAKGKERFSAALSHNGFAGLLFFQLDHIPLFGFDLVTYGDLEFKPEEGTLQTDNPVFRVELRTDYLIFQHQLLRDFEMTARFSRFEVEDIVARWGRVSELRGKILFKRVPEGDLILRAGPITLAELHAFGSHPLPQSLEGVLQGKLNIRGALVRPDLEGAFTVRDGAIDGLSYDLATIHFTGNLPYLALEDSKVVKGKNSFVLKGALDFSLRNFLQGTKLINSEQVVVWKGLTLSRELEEKSGSAPQMDMAYQMGEKTSIHVTAKSEQDKEEYLAVGPKVKF